MWAADPEIPEEIDAWLDRFEMFSIYDVLPVLLSMWNANMKTDVVSVKNRGFAYL